MTRASTRPGEAPRTASDAPAATKPVFVSGEHDHPPRVVPSEELLRGGAQIAISHNRSIYFLRATRFGKLILTK